MGKGGLQAGLQMLHAGSLENCPLLVLGRVRLAEVLLLVLELLLSAAVLAAGFGELTLGKFRVHILFIAISHFMHLSPFKCPLRVLSEWPTNTPQPQRDFCMEPVYIQT